MSIWKYDIKTGRPSNVELETNQCIFCSSQMRDISQSWDKRKYHPDRRNDKLRVCENCGWWQFKSSLWNIAQSSNPSTLYREFGGIGILKEFDPTDLSQPIDDVSAFLALRYESRLSLHPRLFEETVGSVFQNLGYRSKVTGYHNDGGIDVILEGKDNQEIGVQVKRYEGKIKVDQIREFTGTLFLKGFNQGIFVTTSSFQSGAHKVSAIAKSRGISIELLDADKFYDKLKLSRINKYENYDDWEKNFDKFNILNFQEVKNVYGGGG